MFQELVKKVKKAVASSIHSSGNVTITNHGPSSNNKTFINVQMCNTAIKLSNDSATIEELEDKMDEIPGLSEDEFNCLQLTFEPLLLEFSSSVLIIPTLTHKYQTVIIDGYKTESLDLEVRQMLRQLGLNLIDLKFFDCEFDLITLCDILRELPLLQSLELNLKLIKRTNIILNADKLPKLVDLKDIKLEINDEMVKNILNITKNTNIEFLTLFDATFNINEFIYYLKQYKKLTSLSLTNCIVNNASQVMSRLKTLHLNNKGKLPTIDYTNFDCLKQLHTLQLNEVNDELLKVLKSKCIDGLQELTINYTTEQNKNVIRMYDVWKKSKNQNQLSIFRRTPMFTIEDKSNGKYVSSKKLIIIQTLN